MCLLRPFDTASSFFDISSIPLVTMTTIENTPASARRVFNLAPTMTSEDALKEMHAKTAGSTLANKTTLQSIIVVVMSYERICSTARVVAAAAGIAYLPHLLLQYQALIDRVSHAAYLTAVLVGAPPAHTEPCDEHLAEAVDDLESSFDVFISDKRWNNVYTAGRGSVIATANLAQHQRED